MTDITPDVLAQLGLGAVFLWLFWTERRANNARSSRLEETNEMMRRELVERVVPVLTRCSDALDRAAGRLERHD